MIPLHLSIDDKMFMLKKRCFGLSSKNVLVESEILRAFDQEERDKNLH